MRNRKCFWLVLGLAACAAQVRADDKHAIQTFRKLGATITRDETRPGKPVVAVYFGDDAGTGREWAGLRDVPARPLWLGQSWPLGHLDSRPITDATLKDLHACPSLQKLDLCSSQITDDGLKELAPWKTSRSWTCEIPRSTARD